MEVSLKVTKYPLFLLVLESCEDFLERGVVSMRKAMISNINAVGSCCMPFKSGRMHHQAASDVVFAYVGRIG